MVTAHSRRAYAKSSRPSARTSLVQLHQRLPAVASAILSVSAGPETLTAWLPHRLICNAGWGHSYTAAGTHPWSDGRKKRKGRTHRCQSEPQQSCSAKKNGKGFSTSPRAIAVSSTWGCERASSPWQLKGSVPGNWMSQSTPRVCDGIAGGWDGKGWIGRR
jgi:hypothetical protein